MNKEEKTITIYSAATDLKNKTVIFKRTQGEANENFTCEVEALWIFGGNKYYNGSKPSDVVLTQSLANPRLFVYKGEALQADNVKFCATNNWNNEYAFGANDTKDSKTDVTLGQKYSPLYGGRATTVTLGSTCLKAPTTSRCTSVRNSMTSTRTPSASLGHSKTHT